MYLCILCLGTSRQLHRAVRDRRCDVRKLSCLAPCVQSREHTHAFSSSCPAHRGRMTRLSSPITVLQTTREVLLFYPTNRHRPNRIGGSLGFSAAKHCCITPSSHEDLRVFGAGIPSTQSCFDRWARWHCSLCGDVGVALDEDILGCPGIAACGETGECVDQLVAEGIQGLAHCVKNSCFPWPRGAQHVIEGYPLYEPDPALCRKERPTSLTGNAFQSCYEVPTALV